MNAAATEAPQTIDPDGPCDCDRCTALVAAVERMRGDR